MGRPKKTTKSTEPVQPELQPEVVSENFSVPFESTGALDETLQAEEGETLPDPEENPISESDLKPGEELHTVTEADLQDNPALVDALVQEGDQVILSPSVPDTNTLTNLPTLEEGEELYTVTKADLETNPDLAAQGVEEGEEIILGPVMSAEDIVLAAIDCRDEYVEITPTLELLVNNPEDQQANRFLKKLLTGMVADGLIEVQNQVHLLLGSAYYKSGDPVTRYQTLRTVPVYAKKRQ
jgi:sulfur transfer complex TusBCD TusB component (DsrH family)